MQTSKIFLVYLDLCLLFAKTLRCLSDWKAHPARCEQQTRGQSLASLLARDGSLGGFKSVLSQHLDGFKNEGCVQLGPEWDSGLGCNFAVRRLNVWTAAEIEGGVKLSGPGFAVAANNEFPSFGGNAGILSYAAGYNGYGALCRPGNVYELEGVWRDSPVIDVAFSDAALESIFGAEEVTLKTASGFLCSSVRGTTLHRSTWTSSYGATKRMRSFALQQSAKFGDTFHLQHCTWSPHCWRLLLSRVSTSRQKPWMDQWTHAGAQAFKTISGFQLIWESSMNSLL